MANTDLKKIVIDCRCLQDNSRFRGIGTVIRNIIEHIPNKNRYRVLIEKGRGTIESFGIEQLVFKSPLSTANYGQKLAEFLTEHHIDYCHFMAQYNIPDNFNFPYSVTVHDLFNDHLLTNQKKYQTTLAPMLKKLKKAKKLIAISQYTKSSILEWIPDASIEVIYNGFNSSIEKDAQMDVDLAKELNVNQPYILYMGNFEKRKNFIGALRGFLVFSKQYPEYQLVACVGHRPLILPPAIQWLCLKHFKKIKLMSYIKSNQLANLYKKATALLFASHAEGFGLPILEAMSVQTPVVISNTTALPEVGKNAAVYVNPKDPEDIASGLITIIEDSQQQSKYVDQMPAVLRSFDVKSKAAEYDQSLNLA